MRDRDHVIHDQAPKAVVYFVDKDWQLRRDIQNPKVIAPDLDDILNVNVSRGTLGVPGSFSIRLNNKDNKYFKVDDVEDDIQQLNTLDSLTPKRDKYGKEYYPWVDAKTFLGSKTISRQYTTDPRESVSPGIDASFTLEYRDVIDANGDIVTQLGYFDIPSIEMGGEHGEITPQKADQFWVTVSEELRADRENAARTNSDFYTEHGGDLTKGKCLFEPMQRVIILMSRRYPDDKGDLTTVFTGLVSSVTDTYLENLHVVTIQGEDLTKWLRITQVNVNPSFIAETLPDSGDFLLTQHKFSNMEGWKILQTLIVGGPSMGQKGFAGIGNFRAVTTGPDIGVLPSEEIQEKLIAPVGVPWVDPKKTVFGERGPEVFFKEDTVHLQVYHGVAAQKDPTGTYITTPYKLFFRESANSFNNEYSTVWDIIVDVSKFTNFEFYADAEGDLWYHQPRFNNYHILNAPNPEVYVIRDEDILTADFTESDERIITSMFVTGMQDIIKGHEVILDIASFYEDLSFVRKYGRRFLFTHHPYVLTKQDCYYFAKSLMHRINADRFTGQITIIGRPEIYPAMPVFISYRNMIYYIKEISHNFKFGGEYTTTLQLAYGHKPWEVLPEVLDYKTTPPHIAVKELEKVLTVETWPIVQDPEIEDPRQGAYVLGVDIPHSYYAQLGQGYFIGVVMRGGKVYAQSTITGRIVNADLELGCLVIRGNRGDALFDVTYAGLGGETFQKLLRKVGGYQQLLRNAETDLEVKGADEYAPKVREGEIIGEIVAGTIDVNLYGHRLSQAHFDSQPEVVPDAASETAEERRKKELILWQERLQTPQADNTYVASQPAGRFAVLPTLYYAIQRAGRPVYPNEVHSLKFLDADGQKV